MFEYPYCVFSDFYKNGHSYNVSQLYFCKSFHKAFSFHPFNKPKLFFLTLCSAICAGEYVIPFKDRKYYISC